MSREECARCGRILPSRDFEYDPSGMICDDCWELKKREEAEEARQYDAEVARQYDKEMARQYAAETNKDRRAK